MISKMSKLLLVAISAAYASVVITGCKGDNKGKKKTEKQKSEPPKVDKVQTYTFEDAARLMNEYAAKFAALKRSATKVQSSKDLPEKFETNKPHHLETNRNKNLNRSMIINTTEI